MFLKTTLKLNSILNVSNTLFYSVLVTHHMYSMHNNMQLTLTLTLNVITL